MVKILFDPISEALGSIYPDKDELQLTSKGILVFIFFPVAMPVLYLIYLAKKPYPA